MKPRPSIKPLIGVKNVVSINLLRLRRLVARLEPAMVSKIRKARPKHGHVHRASIQAKLGGNCRG